MPEYYTRQELRDIGIKSVGKDVKISKSCVIAEPECVVIGNRSRVDDFAIITGSVEIGSNVHVGPFSFLSGPSGIILEDFSGISARVSIFSSSDDYTKDRLSGPTVPPEYTSLISGEVKISKHCIVGAGSIVLPDLTIGYATTVGAMSLVNKSLDSEKFYLGIPVKMVSQRKSEKIKQYETDYINNLD